MKHIRIIIITILLSSFSVHNSLFAQSSSEQRFQTKLNQTLEKNKKGLIDYDTTFKEIWSHLQFVSKEKEKLNCVNNNRKALQEIDVLYPIYKAMREGRYIPVYNPITEKCNDCEISLGLVKYAANSGNADANWYLGLLYDSTSRFHRDFNFKPDFQKFQDYLSKAHQLGHNEAAIVLANAFRNKQKYSKAVEWYVKVKGHLRSQALTSISVIYREGKGDVVKDQKTANDYLVAAVNDKGSDPSSKEYAQFLYAKYLYLGIEGFNKDVQTAKKILQALNYKEDYSAEKFIKEHNIKF